MLSCYPLDFTYLFQVTSGLQLPTNALVDPRSSSLLDQLRLNFISVYVVQVELLEWADDLEMHHLKGYGESLNYRMGVPLLDDVVQTLDRAMSADRKFLKQNR